MKKGIYRFNADCGRMGNLKGVFIATNEQVKELIKSKIEVYFGEVLGKHSEICGSIEKKQVILLSDDSEAVNLVEKYELTSGFNPFDYTAINFQFDNDDSDDITIREIIDKRLLKKKQKQVQK
ncbi:hypothetical protein OIU80_19785 [Flavobacterium sp. LS1R47]|uniref:Uncharacterized protein n=1 Tax=Flavobacterium frigoritolerans TaxID=2987686 RepID=A0A9X3CAD6_9FLAO|nr:hypothetical protein [Flavobacterium frigoritolerans]MCV9934528.1 hypothetical protein [Flavobacterium frigoritolerans]